MYAALSLALLGALFGHWVRAWLRDNPVLPLNWDYERKYRPAYTPAARPTNMHQVFAASAMTSVSYAQMQPVYYVDPRVMRLPEVGA